MPIERSHATSYELAISMLVLSVIVCGIFTVEVGMTLTVIFRMGQGQMPIERSHVTFYLSAIAMFVLLVAVCEIITYELVNVLDSNL